MFTNPSSHFLETLQVQVSVAVQQGHQWCITWLEQLRQFILQLCEEQHAQHAKDIALRTAASVQRGWQEIQFQYYNAHWNTLGFYHQLGTLCANKVSRREAMFCFTGIALGTVMGYYIGVKWKPVSGHIHHIKAIVCHHYYGFEDVSLIEDVEMPTIKKSNELLIQVKATSLNVIDTKICYGYSRIYRRLLNSKQKEPPITLGRDCAGVIVDIGQGVVNFDIGDEVFLAVPSWAPGTMAQYIIVPETQVAKRPKSCSFEASASLPYNGCLAWDALVNQSVIKEGNAKGKRVFIYGGSTPIGCILTQLIKLWGGYVVTACRGANAVLVMKALGADEVITINETDIEKELEMHDKYDAIFYTDKHPIQEHILKKHLLPHGSYVSTVPEQLTSDSLGLICRSIFAGCIRIKLLVQYMFGFNIHQWKEGAKLDTAYLRALCELTDANQLQTVVDKVYAPYNIEWALQHVLDPNSIGSTIITFK
nr:PREDICTED: reticulon-4-interacting protein 1 homolog, mitochondrial-like isoform X2 [Linepithema humile]